MDKNISQLCKYTYLALWIKLAQHLAGLPNLGLKVLTPIQCKVLTQS